MRVNRLIMIVALGTAMTQFAHAQSKPEVNHVGANAAAKSTNANDASSQTAPDATPNTEPAVARPIASPAPQKQGSPANENREHCKAASNPESDDSKKSPYWEPRDWTYIYNQGP